MSDATRRVLTPWGRLAVETAYVAAKQAVIVFQFSRQDARVQQAESALTLAFIAADTHDEGACQEALRALGACQP